MQATSQLRSAVAGLLLLTFGCDRKPVQAPPPAAPQPRQNLIVLLPDPGGKPSSISVTNAGGQQILSQPYQAVRVERPDIAPSPPFAMQQAEVRRVFGDVLDALPQAEIAFTLNFGEGSDVLVPVSQAQMPAILNAIRERHSTSITLVGHTDTTASPDFNYRLGLQRAEAVAAILRAQGVNASDIFSTSHGDTDLLVQTANGVANALNRRVEVIVR